MQRRQLLASTAALVAMLWAARAAAAVVDESWRDAARDRALPMRLRWPAGDGPCAAVVFSHGLGGSIEGGDAWGRAWCDAGVAMLHVQHPGSDSQTLRAGMLALRRAASAEQLVARVADMHFVLDEIERRVHAGLAGWRRVRTDAMGAAGHSFGAQTVQALAGKRYGRPAPGLAEPRFKAFIAFSPSLGRGERMSPAEQFGAVTRPFLCVTGSLDGDPLGGAMSGEDRARVYEGLPSGRRALLWLDHADHMTFGANAERRIDGRGAFRRTPEVAANEAAQHALVATITTDWWRARLLGDAAAMAALRAPAGLGTTDRWRMD